MKTSSKKTYPKRNNRQNVNYSTFEYDSCTEGLSTDKEDELDNIYLHDLYDSENLDFGNVVVDNNVIDHNAEVIAGTSGENVDFAVDVPVKKKRVEKVKRKAKEKPIRPSNEKSYDTSDVTNILPQFSPIRDPGFHLDAPLWEHDGVLLGLQWKDNRIITMLSSIDNASECVLVNRKIKINDAWTNVQLRQPMAIHTYNKYMNSVDKSDQILSTNNVIRKCLHSWKTLFFHMIDIAVINGYILFQSHRNNNPDNELLKRSVRYATINFREELIRNLEGPPKVEPTLYETAHIPKFLNQKRNCVSCLNKKECNIYSYCSAPQCGVYLHYTAAKNCFDIWHKKDYHRYF